MPSVAASGPRWPWLLVIVALNVAAVTLVVSGLRQLHARTLREAEARSQNIALAFDLHLSSTIARIDLSLQTVASELGRHMPSDSADRRQRVGTLIRQQKAALPEAEGWSVVDPLGNVLVHEGGVGALAFSVADRDYFRDLQSGRVSGLVISKPLKSRLSRDWILILARAIYAADGRFDGIVAVPLPVTSLAHRLSGFELAPNDIVTLRDADLGLITQLPDQASGKPLTVGEATVSPELHRLVDAGKRQATYTAVAPTDGVERIFSYRRLAGAPVYVFVGIAKADFLAEWRHSAWLFSTVFALSLLACNATAGLVYRQWREQRRGAAVLQEANRRLEGALRQSRERDDALIAAQEAGQLGTYTLNFATAKIASSPYIDTILGIGADYPHTIDGWLALVHPDDQEAMRTHMFGEVVGRGLGFDREYRVVRPADQQIVWVHGLGRIDFDAQGQPLHMRGTVQNVSVRHSADERLQLAAEVFSNATEGLVVTDRAGVIIEVNPAFTRITGYSADEAKGRNPRMLKSGTSAPAFYARLWADLEGRGAWDGEFTNRRKDGSTYIQHSRIFSIRDTRDEVVRYAAVISDVTAIKESQQRLEHLAYHDELTGLPNRARLAERLRDAMDACRRQSDRLLGVCYLDLDGFSAINEGAGQEAGDQLLVEVGRRLALCVDGDDIVARLGGDEFVVVFNGLRSQNDLRRAATRLIETSSEPYTVGKSVMSITLSVGVAVYPFAGIDEPDALLRQADQAMYEAKRRGKSGLYFFDAQSEQRQRARQRAYDRLVEALAAHEFRLHYQPKVSLRTGAIVGVEALLRWQHPVRGLLPPQEFLPVIEGSELTLPLGEWILREALAQQQRWAVAGLAVGVSVNIFGHHLQRADFVECLAALLGSYPGLAAGMLDLEVLETTALEKLEEVTARINGCRRLGVKFSLDDFGTGYSSLAYLRRLPVDDVKIDRSFVRDMLGNPDDQALVESIVNMAHALGRQVVAEGVESAEHGALLIRLGCDMAQGYGIARPMPPEDFPRWAAGWSKPAAWG